MSSSVSVIFKCVEVNEDIVNDVLPTREVIAIKGFASRLDPTSPLEKELEEFVAPFDMIAFDGDDLKEDSFTRYIAALVHSRCIATDEFENSSPQSTGKTIALHAVKFASEVQDLIDSWNDVAVSFEHDATMNYLSMTTRKLDSDSRFCKEDNVNLVEVCIYYRAVFGLPKADDEGQKYVNLGVHHLELVNPKAVVTLGGGKILVDEFKAEIDEFGRQERNRKWHLFRPTARRKAQKGSSSEEKEVEVCSLVEVDHPQLIKHL